MAKTLVYQGCQGQDAALVEWESQNIETPSSYKTELTPIKVFISPPSNEGGEFSVYQFYELFYTYSIVDFHTPDGIPTPITRTTDSEGNPLGASFTVFGAPRNLRQVFDRTAPSGTDVYIWTVSVDGIQYEQIYNEVTEQFEQVDVPYTYDAGLIQTYSEPLPSGQTYGEVTILEIYCLDSDGNRIEFGGGANTTTWLLIVESLIDGNYEQVFQQSFVSEPQDVRVDCDQCSNKCLKVTTDDKKRFTCVCRELT